MLRGVLSPPVGDGFDRRDLMFPPSVRVYSPLSEMVPWSIGSVTGRTAPSGDVDLPRPDFQTRRNRRSAQVLNAESEDAVLNLIGRPQI
jgi:hypothetical protein